MQRIIDHALDLVPPTGALTTQDEAALARLTRFVSTVDGAEALTWFPNTHRPADASFDDAQGYFLSRPTRPQLIPESYSHVAAHTAMSSC